MVEAKCFSLPSKSQDRKISLKNKTTKQTSLHTLAGIMCQASEEFINSDSLQH